MLESTHDVIPRFLINDMKLSQINNLELINNSSTKIVNNIGKVCKTIENIALNRNYIIFRNAEFLKKSSKNNIL
jgi:hypothetical protein